MTPVRPDPPPPGWADALQQAHRAFAQAERRWRESLADVQARLGDLQARHAALQDEHSGCAERLRTAEAVSTGLAQQLAQVQADAEQLRGHAEALEQQLDRLRAELTEAQSGLLQAQQHDAEQREAEAGRLADAQARLLQVGTLLDSSGAELRESQRQQRRLLANVEALTGRLEQSRSEAAAQREAFERERQALTARLAERDSEGQFWREREQLAREQAARQEGELRRALEAAREELAGLQEQHRQAMAAHELSRQASSRDLLQATASRDLAQALLQDRTAEAESLRRELQRLTAGLGQLAETTARQQAAVQEQLAVAERRLEDRTRQLERSERVVTDLRQQLGSAHHDLDRLRLDLAEQTRRGAERELAETRRWQDLHAELDAQHGRERAELDAQHGRERAEITSRLEALAAAGRELEAQLGHSREVGGALQARIDQLGEQLASEREQARTALQGARAELAMAQEAFRALAATRTMALESLDELREQQRLRWIQEHASETLTVIANLRTLLDDAVSRRDELATELMVLRNMAQPAPPPAEPAPVPGVAFPPAAVPDDHPPPAQAAAPPEPAEAAAERPAATAPLARPSEPLHPIAMAMNTPHSVQDLLTLFDEAFVQACYRLVLGREADGPGLATHLALLRQGVAKEQLIIAMAGSEEGRLAARPVAGLDELVRQASEVPTGLRGRVVRRLAAEAGTLSRQDLASVENRFGAALQAVQGEQQRVRTGQDELVQRMTTLVQHVEQLGQRLQGRLERLDAGQAELAVVLARQDQALARCEAACAGIARQVQALGGVLSVPAGQIDGGLAAAASAAAPGSPPPGDPGAGMPLHSVASVRQLLASPGGAA